MKQLGTLEKNDKVEFFVDGKKRTGRISLVNGQYIIVKYRSNRKSKLVLLKRWNLKKVYS